MQGKFSLSYIYTNSITVYKQTSSENEQTFVHKLTQPFLGPVSFATQN